MRESAWILSHHGGLLSLLASTLVLPLCFMLLSHTLVSVPLIQRIRQDKEFVQAHSGTDAARDRQTDLSSEWVYLLIFFTVYLLCVLAFSLLSTAAVVYSVACMYLENSISYRKVISVVPTVWKRLIVTFLWVFILIFRISCDRDSILPPNLREFPENQLRCICPCRGAGLVCLLLHPCVYQLHLAPFQRHHCARR
ncbi:hypothetical protein KP509_29G010100 [Ceratopteris richardii]|uniref:Uncharacterized protein n=1 Tax=Ceratopteris richardii TaxID=49495 RepID=A0A8T2R6D6_CERRI|nr:hypothetical protein KP509_29G010100 [Ceratopteris richardii]